MFDEGRWRWFAQGTIGLTRDQMPVGVKMPTMFIYFVIFWYILCLKLYEALLNHQGWCGVIPCVFFFIFAGLLAMLFYSILEYRTARSVRPLWTSYIRNGRGAWTVTNRSPNGPMVPRESPRLYPSNEQLLESFELLVCQLFGSSQLWSSMIYYQHVKCNQAYLVEIQLVIQWFRYITLYIYYEIMNILFCIILLVPIRLHFTRQIRRVTFCHKLFLAPFWVMVTIHCGGHCIHLVSDSAFGLLPKLYLSYILQFINVNCGVTIISHYHVVYTNLM